MGTVGDLAKLQGLVSQDLVIGSVGKVVQALSLSLRTVGMEGGLGDDVRVASTYVKRHPAGEFPVFRDRTRASEWKPRDTICHLM